MSENIILNFKDSILTFKPVDPVFKAKDPKDSQVRFSSRRLYFKKFFEKLGSPQFVQFYIDKENKLLAVAPCSEESPRAIMIQRAAFPYVPLPLEVYQAVKPSYNKNGYFWVDPEFALLNIDDGEGQYLLISYARRG